MRLLYGSRDGAMNIRCVCVECEDIGTSVNEISKEDEKNIVGYYNFMGQKLQKEPERGIFIILYDNGISEKIIK